MENNELKHSLSTPFRRKLYFAILYFCEGAPIGFIWWLLPTQLRLADVPVDRITLLTSILVIPWALKFLWAPAVDTIQSRRWTLKSWIIASQLFMILTLLPLLVLDFSSDVRLIVILLLLHTLSAATQDVAIDALCISTVPKSEQGVMNGWMQAGMLAGRSLFGGGAIMAAAYVGLPIVLTAMICVIAAVTFLLLFSSVRTEEQSDQKTFGATFRTLRSVFERRSTWFGLAFAVLGGFAYEGVGIVAGPFFVDRGIAAEQIGIFFSFISVGAMITGALIGGFTSDRVGKQRSVKMMTAVMSASVLMLAVIDSLTAGSSTAALFAGMAAVYVSIGLFTASSYALFMEVTDKRLGATQFSTFMGGTNVCESLAGFSAGTLIVSFGYPVAFALLAVVSLISISLVRSIRSA